VIRVIIEYDLVPIPVPVIAVRVVELADAEVKTSKPETRRASTCQPEAMLGAEAASKAPVHPLMIQVKASVVTAEIMSDPLAVRVNMRSHWMPRPVGRSVVLRSGVRLSSKWRRAMLRNVTAATMFLAPALCTGRNRKQQHDRQTSDSSVHVCLPGE